jgi:SAM-dependent methyltransferase
MDDRYVEQLRLAEVELALAELRRRKPPGASVIEIGGGAGWQARALAAAGYKVRSFDLPDSQFSRTRVFPVEDYDGRHIPAADASFDAAFSSNVLEHIADGEVFQAELRRVLKPDAVAVHILPSATWRLYTSLAHYPWLVKAALDVTRSGGGPTRSADAEIVACAAQRRSKPQLLSRILWSPRHGEKGNALSEVWQFSRWSWTRFFERTGWQVLSRYPNGLFYTGYGLLSDRLSVGARRRLSRILGSSCHVYVLGRRAHS